MLLAERNTDSLRVARDAILDVSRDINRTLASYEGTSAVLTFGDIAADASVDLTKLTKGERFAFFLAAESALDFRGWTRVESNDGRAHFTKKPTVTEHRKPATSPRRSRKA